MNKRLPYILNLLRHVPGGVQDWAGNGGGHGGENIFSVHIYMCMCLGDVGGWR